MPVWMRELVAGAGASMLLVGLVVGSGLLFPIALALGAGAYVGLRLVLPVRDEGKGVGSLTGVIRDLERHAARFDELSQGISRGEVAENARDLARLTRDLVPQFERAPDNVARARAFLDLQLPRAVQLVERYAWLARQPYLDRAAGEELEASERTIERIEKAFEEQHRRLVSEDVREFGLDRRVFEELLTLDERLDGTGEPCLDDRCDSRLKETT